MGENLDDRLTRIFLSVFVIINQEATVFCCDCESKMCILKVFFNFKKPKIWTIEDLKFLVFVC